MKMNIKTSIILAALIGLVAFACNIVSAQEKGASALMRPAVTETNHVGHVLPCPTDRVSSVVGGKSTLNSNLKSRGFVGPYEIVAVRERGLFGPSTVATVVYDARTGGIGFVNEANSAGIGVAMVNGASLAGSSFLFGHSLRPDQQTINNGSSTSSNGNTANANGNGGSATAGSTGGTANGNGGSATAGSTSNGGNATANGNGGSATAGSTATGGTTPQTVNVNSGSANGNGIITVGTP